MLRKLAIAIAASGAMISATNVLALGMGDIELESALNQPLDARIKLLKASELENWEMKPNLASSEEFEKSGVEHVFFLNNLQFEIERSGEEVYIHVTSNQPVVEPFLNFLVQVDWPNGRLLREYTLLLDPPVFTEDPVEPVVPTQSEEFEDDVAPESMALPGTAPTSSKESAMEMPVEKMVEPKTLPAPVVPEKEQEATYKVRANDTLWEVAIRTRADRSITPQQAMLAIQDLNPNAFINGNINRLKKNQVLRVPSEEQMLSRSFEQAVSEVALQNQAMAKRKAQLDATRKDAAIQRANKLEGAQLKLLAGGEATTENERSASGQVSSKTAGDQSKLEKELSITLENLDKTTRENQELRTRLDSLEEQINTLQRLINLKDEQMVALQSGMAEKPEMKKDDIVQVAEGDKGAVKPAEDLNFAEKKPEPVKEAKDKVEKPEVKKPKFTPVEPVEEEFDPVAFVMENPPVLGAGLGALLLALLGINYARKRKEKQQEEPLSEASSFNGDDPLDAVELDGDFNEEFDSMDQGSDLDLDEFEEGGLSDFETAESDSGLLGGADADVESEDVLGEVDVYMAYNRLDPARALLDKSIESHPNRMDFRLKLAEVLQSMDDQDALAEQVEYIAQNGSDEDRAKVAQFQSGAIEEVNEDFAMDFGMDDDLGLSTNEQSNEDFASELTLDEDSDLDFDLDGLELNDSDGSAELDLDSELNFETSMEDSLASDDLSLDFDTEVDAQNAESDLDIGLDSISEDDNSMDFDLGEFESTSEDLDLAIDDASTESASESADLEDLDALSLDSDDAGLDFDVSLSDDDEISLDFETPSIDAEIPALSDVESDNALSFDLDESDDLSLDFDANEESDLSFESLGEDASDIELGSVDASTDSLPEFEEGLSFEEDEMELPELTEEVGDDLDAELDALSGDDIELPTLEAASADIDELPELDDDFDLAVAAPAEELESVEDVAAEYKEELPTLDSGSDDDFPPLGDLGDIDLDNLDNDLDFLSGTDESETKLDLARAYIDMEDQEGAREILQEVLEEGNDQQKQEATKLLDSLV